MIKNQMILLEKEQAGETADKYFMGMCGYDNGKAGSKKKIERAVKCLEDIYDQLEIKVLISEYPGSCVDGTNLKLDHERFTCKVLSQIPAGAIERIYVYLMTAGEPVYTAANTLNEVYCDLWQNAYVDAGVDVLRHYLQELKYNEEMYVSKSIGPGFYGMEASEIKRIFAILDSGKIELKLLDSGFISPVKSFAGFFIVTSNAWDFADENCLNCPASGPSCKYCKVGYSQGH